MVKTKTEIIEWAKSLPDDETLYQIEYVFNRKVFQDNILNFIDHYHTLFSEVYESKHNYIHNVLIYYFVLEDDNKKNREKVFRFIEKFDINCKVTVFFLPKNHKLEISNSNRLL